MNGLRKFFDNRAQHFTAGGRFEQLYPIFSGVDEFFYSRGEVTTGAPHVRDGINIKRIMMVVLIALMPVVFMALYNTGLQANHALVKLGSTTVDGWRGGVLMALGIKPDTQSVFANVAHGALYFLPVYLLSLVAGGVWESAFAIMRRREVDETFLVITLLFALLMPPTIPWWQVVLGISFGMVMGKLVFGGMGMNILNPALVGYAFLFFAYPAQIAGDAVWVAVDGVTAATPLALFQNGPQSELPGWIDAFVGVIPGAMGETSAVACLVGALILLLTGIGSGRVMLSVITGMAVVSLLFNAIGSETNPMFQITPWWHLVVGGFAFGTVYLATDPVTGALTQTGKIVYGLLIGVLAVLVRVVNPAFTEGMMLAILFGNVFAPVIDRAVIYRNVKRRQRRSGG